MFGAVVAGACLTEAFLARRVFTLIGEKDGLTLLAELILGRSVAAKAFCGHALFLLSWIAQSRLMTSFGPPQLLRSSW